MNGGALDGAFVEGLAHCRAGRLLSTHLAAVELRTTSGSHDTSVTEALSNERIFIHALSASVYAGKPYPCGLTAPLPNFVAILNLSGERMMVFSQSPALIRKLCAHSSALHTLDLAEALQAFEAFPKQTPAADVSHFVLLSYSLPWQAGTASGFWRLSACRIVAAGGNQDGEAQDCALVDHILTLSSSSASVFRAKSVMDASDHSTAGGRMGERLELVTKKQIGDFEEEYSAACLDSCPLPKHIVDAANTNPPQVVEMIQMLQRSRAKELAENKVLRQQLERAETNVFNALKELRKERKEAEDKLKGDIKAERKKTDEIRSLGKQESAARQAEIERMQQAMNKTACEQNRSTKAHDRLVAKVEEIKRQTAAKDALHNAALAKHVGEIVKLQARLDASVSGASTQKAQLDAEHAKLVMSQQTLHIEIAEKLKATIASKERIINQLSENNERRDVEVASLKTHDDEQAATIERLQQEIAALTADANRSASVGTSTCNASTATHHCASTQTAPLSVLEVPSPSAPKALTNLHVYQTAVDHLQELVNHTRGSVPALQAKYPNYPMPLPFPHFTPSGYCAVTPPNPYRDHR